MLAPASPLDYQWGHAVNSRELLEGVKRGIHRAVQRRQASTVSHAARSTSAVDISVIADTAADEQIRGTDTHSAACDAIAGVTGNNISICVNGGDTKSISVVGDEAVHHDHHSHLEGGYVNAVEADVIWSETQQTPVMGHPPQTDGDLSLADFLDEMQALATMLLQSALDPDPRQQLRDSDKEDDNNSGNDSDQQSDAETWTPHMSMAMSTTVTTQPPALPSVSAATTAQAALTPSRTPLIVKLDFKSMHAFRASYDLLRAFVVSFPFSRGVFVNADILVGPANSSDIAFPDARAFLQLATALGDGGDDSGMDVDGDTRGDGAGQRGARPSATGATAATDNSSSATTSASHAHKLVLSVGWTTANASEDEWRRMYSHDMVDAMLQTLVPYTPSVRRDDDSSATASGTGAQSASSSRSPSVVPTPLVHVTFPVRATSVRASWDALERLLHASPSTFGFTLWWSGTQLPDEELEWLFSTLEETTLAFAARTFYDILGFESFLQRRRRHVVVCEA